MIPDQSHTIVVVLGSTPTVGEFSPSQNVGVFLENFVRTQLKQPPIPFVYFKDHDKQIPLLLDKTFAEQNITKDYIIYMDVKVSPQKGTKKIKVVCEIEIKDDESVQDKVQHFLKSTYLQYFRKADIKQTEVIDAKSTCLSLNLKEGSIIYCQQLNNQFPMQNQTSSYFSGPQEFENQSMDSQQQTIIKTGQNTPRLMESGTGFINLMFKFKLPENMKDFTVNHLADSLIYQLANLERVEIDTQAGFQSVLSGYLLLAHFSYRLFFLRFIMKRSPNQSALGLNTKSPLDSRIGIDFWEEEVQQADVQQIYQGQVYVSPTTTTQNGPTRQNNVLQVEQ